MKFDINKFADRFKETIDWMLNGDYGEGIKEHLKWFKDKQNILKRDPDNLEALRTIIEVIRTKSWRLRVSNYESEWNAFVNHHGRDFRNKEAREELIRLAGGGSRNKEKIERLLSYPTLREFTENLYNLAKQGGTEVLGEKGRDNYLRDFGYWDRVPMDRHEIRFIIRSGIYHTCSDIQNSDPSEKGDLQKALIGFCEKYLKGYKVEGIDLGKAPGMVDIFIWSFSMDRGYRICGATPRCEECKLKDVCLYGSYKT